MSSNTLPISVGILAWNSGATLVNTLESYKKNGLLDMVEDVHVLFQECTEEDIALAKEYKITYLPIRRNIGIGYGFSGLAECANADHFLPLEHDWELIEDATVTRDRLTSGLEMIKKGFKGVRYRHRKNYGDPLYSRQVYEGKELEHRDSLTGLTSPHLMDCVHWIENPHERFPDKIKKEGEYFTSTSRWSNWTNGPCLFNKEFYKKIVQRFSSTTDLLLEPSVTKWWAQKQYPVCWGEGLFKHNDIKKWGPQ